MVFERLTEQLTRAGQVVGTPVPWLGLAYGHATAHNQTQLEAHFREQNWLLLGPEQIRERVLAMASEPYDNQVASVVAKLFRPVMPPSSAELSPIFTLAQEAA